MDTDGDIMYKLEDLNNDKIVFELHRKMWNKVYNICMTDSADKEKFIGFIKHNALDSLYLNKIIDKELYDYISWYGGVFCSASHYSEDFETCNFCNFCIKHNFIKDDNEKYCLGGLYLKTVKSYFNYCKSEDENNKQELLGYIKEIKLLGKED